MLSSESLSESLTVLKRWFDEARDGLFHFDAERASTFSALMEEAIEEARLLEERAQTADKVVAFPGPRELTSERGENVVSFPRAGHGSPCDSGA